MNRAFQLISRLRETSFFRRLLLSYVVGLVVILLIVSLVCVNLIGTISDFSNRMVVNVTTQFQSAVESLMASMQKMPTELSINPTVASLMNSEQTALNAYQRYNTIHLVSLLKGYRLVNPFIEGIFLYFPNQDYLISDQGVYSLNLWNRIYLQNDQLDGLLAEKDDICWESLGGIGKFSGKTVMCAKLPSDIDTVRGNLFVFLNPVLAGVWGELGTDEPAGFYTVNAAGSILFRGGALTPPDVSITYDLIDQSRARKGTPIQLRGDYIGYAMPSNTYQVYHLIHSPQSAFFSTLMNSQRAVLLSCIFTLLLGLALSIVSARRKSRPVLRIANIMKEDGQERMVTLEKIEQSVIDLVRIKDKANQYYAQYQQLQSESFLLKLMHHEIESEEMLQTIMEQNGICIPGDTFIVATVVSAENRPAEDQYKRLCAVLRAYIPDTIDLHFFSGVDEIKVVVIGKASELTVRSIKDDIQKAIRYLEADCDAGFRVAISEMYHSLFRLGLAYEETQKVNEYNDFFGTVQVMTYGELTGSQSTNENSLIFDMWLNKFANTLATHDFASARSIQKDIFRELSKHEYSLQFVKCKIFSFIDRTMNIIGEMDIVYTAKLWDDLRLADRLLACATLSELESVYSDIFSQLTQIVIDTDCRETKVERILGIIHSCYTDPNFGVSSAANQLGSSVAYVSRVFKEGLGCNMVNYIQRLRIDLAKKLLVENPDMTIVQIAAQCGFNSNITFTRVFKSCEGISPGRFRSQPVMSSEPKI